MSIEKLIRTQLQQQALTGRIIIAYSGGVDSHVLLHVLQQQTDIQCEAIHINHQLNPQSKAWAKHCGRVCKNLNVPLTVMTLNLSIGPQDSTEAIARQQRYSAFVEHMKPGDTLLTAHHRDDQAETVLLQLMRGAGPKGIASMPNIKPLGPGTLLRPLLDCPQSLLKKYALQNHLQWIEDDSNQNTQFDRNFIRHTILPQLQQRWPSASTCLQRSAQHCAMANLGLSDLAQIDSTISQKTLNIDTLIALPMHRRHNVIRHWLQHHHCRLPDTKQLDTIDTMLFAHHDRQPLITIKQYEIRRFKGELHLCAPLAHHNSTIVIPWDCQDNLILPADLGTLIAADIKKQLPRQTQLNTVTVRFRQGGEKIALPGQKNHKSLKKLFQEKGIATWLRNRVPLIYAEDQLLFPVFFHTGG